MYIQLLKDKQDQIWLRLVPHGGIMAVANKADILNQKIDAAGVLAESEYSPHYVEVFDVEWIIDNLLGKDNIKVYRISGIFAATMEVYKCLPEVLAIWKDAWNGN